METDRSFLLLLQTYTHCCFALYPYLKHFYLLAICVCTDELPLLRPLLGGGQALLDNTIQQLRLG